MNYSEMTDKELLAFCQNFTHSDLWHGGLSELATRFKAKCQEVEVFHNDQKQSAEYRASVASELTRLRQENERLQSMLNQIFKDCLEGAKLGNMTLDGTALHANRLVLAELQVMCAEVLSLRSQLSDAQKEIERLGSGLEAVQRHKFLLSKELETAHIGLKGLTPQLSEARRQGFLAGVHYADTTPREQDATGEDAAANEYIRALYHEDKGIPL
jgi:hypothetical protein